VFVSLCVLACVLCCSSGVCFAVVCCVLAMFLRCAVLCFVVLCCDVLRTSMVAQHNMHTNKNKKKE
jgi:hypothetical protein